MAAEAVALASQFAHLEPLVGEEKGQIFELSSERVRIGRAEGNDLVVQTEGVSRQHAILMKSEGSWFIQDQGSKNGILVNGKKCTETWLTDGDIVQIGNFVFRFRDPEAVAPAPTVDAGFAAPADPMVDSFMAPVTEPEKPKSNKRILIYGAVGLVVALVVMNGGKKDDVAPAGESALLQQREQIRAQIDTLAEASDPQQIQQRKKFEAEIDRIDRTLAKKNREFDGAKKPDDLVDDNVRRSPVVAVEDPVYKAAESAMGQLDWSNPNLLEAEQFFRRGQREYLQGSLQRSIDSFRTSLSFYRGHKLAEHYLQRALYEAETEAKKNMQLGLQYFESLQYQRAIYHFTEVVALMAHRPKEKIVSEAESYITICRRTLQAAEMFP